MIQKIIRFSLNNKLIILLMVGVLIGVGLYAISRISIGAVPDITNNQVQVITTSRDLSTEEVERYLTYPVELAMSNIPGVTEIRSISKFGLSVVTVVFEDEMGTYLPRQLISEKLSTIGSEIPQGFGEPSMGPISTGLGEIYQYTLDVKQGYEDRYTVTDLRTIQDWIVKRQLSGIDGVVEVNTWGGYLKTYEVAVDPNKLRAMGISIDQVYQVLSDNNSVAGGGYIEKAQEAYFIRADGVMKSSTDIENTVVDIIGGIPVYVRDIGKVVEGHATRFGAITGNGEGEKVLGQVMMLKGADSKKVIEDVQKRVDEIQSSLPEGVYINPVLDRSELIGKTTFTVAENLILGFLIVLFVVVILLGSWRSGLVVASVIPLTLLFALTMMHVFDVDANLMSLGAIDFGIIIDGAVIIVEYITYMLTQNGSSLASMMPEERQSQVNDIVFTSSQKMMHSAVFGQIIIIIVFIPILSLTGVEGKMFGPMALTFCFALIGAMILCFTYVPVIASLVLKPEPSTKTTWSVSIFEKLRSIYERTLTKALSWKEVVLAASLVLLGAALFLFNSMGGEFVPTLDEGDFVIQPVLKTGMSLSETVAMTTRIEKIVTRFPEVKQVVTRIGAAEVPTDPMSMEESDVIITLQPISEWTSAETKDELADVLKEGILREIPGIEIEFTQPIEMRFNELISGARADLAIKLFGEDLGILYDKAKEIETKINRIEGAADISVEKIDGLPQMSVTYDREKLAKYGINISALNDIVSMAFAGKSAGVVFEGEKRFDLVIRYDEAYRNDISKLEQTLVSMPDGSKLPLNEFATISYAEGPAKISRDNTKRRVVIGVNVRGRDIQSVVDDVRSIIEGSVDLPPGYHIQYGGQFENLNRAKARLMVAVPIALFLIFIMLYFAFHSIREAFIIYSAIPLATIGGIVALWLRGMPFSISAGVGFIALFGIAVLNGIVMIEHFKELIHQHKKFDLSMIIKGASDRLRPVLLTTIAAALGFLPMAISTSAGAEVQKPLATVVIGGLITATLLTLILLPIIYWIFGQRTSKSHLGNMGTIMVVLFISLPFFNQAQTPLTLTQMQEIALSNNANIKNAHVEVERQKILIDAVNDWGRSDFYYQHDRNNLNADNLPLHVLGADHTFTLPSVYRQRRQAQKSYVLQAESVKNWTRQRVQYEVAVLYEQLTYLSELQRLYAQSDSIFGAFVSLSEKKNSIGENDIIEVINAKTQRERLVFDWKETMRQYHITKQQLSVLINVDYDFEITDDNLKLLTVAPTTQETHYLTMLQSQREVTLAETEVAYEDRKPQIQASLFAGMANATSNTIYPGVQLGVSLPLSTKAYKAKREAGLMAADQITNSIEAYKNQRQTQQTSYAQLLDEIRSNIALYDTQITQPNSQLLTASKRGFDLGSIDHFQYLMTVNQVTSSKVKLAEMIHHFNLTYLALQYSQF